MRAARERYREANFIQHRVHTRPLRRFRAAVWEECVAAGVENEVATAARLDGWRTRAAVFAAEMNVVACSRLSAARPGWWTLWTTSPSRLDSGCSATRARPGTAGVTRAAHDRDVVSQARVRRRFALWAVAPASLCACDDLDRGRDAENVRSAQTALAMRTRWFHLYECGLGFDEWRPRARRRPLCGASGNAVASAERTGEPSKCVHQCSMTQLRIANAGPATQAIEFVISTAAFLAASGSRVLTPASPHGEPTPTRCSCFKFAAGREWLLVADDPSVGTIIRWRARTAQTAYEPCSCESRLLSQPSPSGAEPSLQSALESDLLGPLAQM